MEKYKYKIGDKVWYEKTLFKDVECEKCHHIETEYTYKKVFGKIEKRKYELVYNLANGFVTSEDVEIVEGKKVITPYLIKMEVSKKVPCYLIKGGWYEETNLKLK